MKRKNIQTKRLVRYSLTGLLTTVVHIVVASVAIEFAKMAVPFANGIAFSVATAVSYHINTLWSFSAIPHGVQLMRFFVVSVLGMLLAMAVSASMQTLGVSYIYGIAAVVVTVPPVTFFLHSSWTYR